MQLIGATSALLAARVACALINLGLLVGFAAKATAQDLGVIVGVLAISTIAAAVTPLGLNTLLTREVVAASGRMDEQTQLLRAAFWSRASAAIVFAVLVPAVLARFDGLALASHRDVLTALLLADVVRAGAVNQSLMESQGRFAALGAVQLAAVLAAGLAKAWIVIVDPDAGLFLLACCLEAVIFGLIHLYVGWRSTYEHSLRLSLRRLGDRAASLLSVGWPLALSALFALINLRVDQVMLVELAGESEAGVYGLAARMMDSVILLSAAASAVLFPILVRQKSGGVGQEQVLTRQAFVALALATWAGAFAAMIITLMLFVGLGAPYVDAASVLPILLVATALIGTRELVSRWLVLEQLLLWSLCSQALGAAANVGLNFVMIPAAGLHGAAAATCVSYAMSSVIVFLLSPQTRPVAIWYSRGLLLGPVYWREGLAVLRAR